MRNWNEVRLGWRSTWPAWPPWWYCTWSSSPSVCWERAKRSSSRSSSILSTFTIIATWIDGGFLNGTVEVVTTKGLVWCQAVFGYSLSLLMGGLIIAGPMWRAGYVTMMDPLQETFGVTMASLLFLPSLAGEICWCGSILNALGSTVSVVTGLNDAVSIGVSAAVAVLYTITGGVYSVAYTDVVQLTFIFVGLVSRHFSSIATARTSEGT
ncbi:hypothetical protein V5799_017758 [Amblyomma americanum]|uniref:Uncharacterized protein n=1 Tax=Amblyomma americanum TaxID=6943 RepID=A0AAQ4F1U8_AMBAM